MAARVRPWNNLRVKELDNEATQNLNLYYFGARYYDAAVGQWLSVDPKAKKYPMWSPYNYGLDNPLRFIDPNGNAPCNGCQYPINFVDFGNGFTRFVSNKVHSFTKTTINKVQKVSQSVASKSTYVEVGGIGLMAVGGAVDYFTGGLGGNSIIDFGMDVTTTGYRMEVSAKMVSTGVDLVKGDYKKAGNEGFSLIINVATENILNSTSETYIQSVRSYMTEGSRSSVAAARDATSVIVGSSLELKQRKRRINN